MTREICGLKSAFLKLVLVAVSSCLTLSCLEVGFRVFHPARFSLWQSRSHNFQLDKDLIYSLKPGSTGRWETEEFVEETKINSYGLRGGEITGRSGQQRRILIVGDSFTYGQGVNNDQTYPHHLEKLIFEQTGRRVEVINAGVKGYGTDQEYRFFRLRLCKLKPDILILALHAGDLYDNIDRPLYSIENDELYPLEATRNWIYFLSDTYFRAPRIIQNSALFNFVLNRLRHRDLFSQLPPGELKELVEWSRRKIILAITGLHRLAAREGFKLAVVCMPLQPHYDAYSSFKAGLSGAGIPFVDTSGEPVWAERNSELFFPRDGHLTPAGNRVLAEQIYRALENIL